MPNLNIMDGRLRVTECFLTLYLIRTPSSISKDFANRTDPDQAALVRAA